MQILVVITHKSFSKGDGLNELVTYFSLQLKQDKQGKSGHVSSSPQFAYCLLIRVILPCVSRVKEDGTRYKKTRNPRQFTNGRKKEKDSRALFLKQVGNKRE